MQSTNFTSRLAILIATVMLYIPAQLRAAIINTTGAVVVASPPSNISTGAWESDTEIRAFAERQNATLSGDLAVNITSPGTSPTNTSQNLSPGTIAAGTKVNSYFLHFDVIGAPSDANAVSAIGSITMDSDILGIAIIPAALNATDSVLGLPGLTYATNQGPRGLEITPGQFGTLSNDAITLSANHRTVSLVLSDAGAPDEVRIFTSVPEPSSSLMLLTGTAGLLATRSLRRRTKTARHVVLS